MVRIAVFAAGASEDMNQAGDRSLGQGQCLGMFPRTLRCGAAADGQNESGIPMRNSAAVVTANLVALVPAGDSRIHPFNEALAFK